MWNWIGCCFALPPQKEFSKYQAFENERKVIVSFVYRNAKLLLALSIGMMTCFR